MFPLYNHLDEIWNPDLMIFENILELGSYWIVWLFKLKYNTPFVEFSNGISIHEAVVLLHYVHIRARLKKHAVLIQKTSSLKKSFSKDIYI